MGHTKILLVEDNAFLQQITCSILKKCGLEADIASTGAEAIIYNSINAYDLILLDCDLPDLSGYEVAKELRIREKESQRKAKIIIALTANKMQDDREKCLEAGMNDCIYKPLSEGDIIRLNNEWLIPYLSAS